MFQHFTSVEMSNLAYLAKDRVIPGGFQAERLINPTEHHFGDIDKVTMRVSIRSRRKCFI